ncbi:CBS domain-containing protein [Methanohalophilus mahii]|uniref:Transcriptional regulator, XRE family n=1 Tax=Methanohalophilus mahii (strain ATCC 35705 / DSM 5219 / SLP) TaxID=547558 RepID=D5EBT2_METMS|nr:CBS domain-containing protein [Methanohalophilus mahii]ADE36633.1 transcriptional regulator, XRE family [Methanohalophilus mahii DSM 5219]
MILPTAQSIKQQRIELGLTQSGLAKRAGVSQPLIARIEAGDVDPRLSTLRKIFAAFDQSEKEKICVRDIMHTLVVFVSSDESVDHAVSIMQEHGYSQVPVIDNGVPVGSISEDMFVRSMAENKTAMISKMKVGDMMGESFPAVSPEADIGIVSTLLERYPAVLVLEKGVAIGFITKHDIIKLLHG